MTRLLSDNVSFSFMYHFRHSNAICQVFYCLKSKNNIFLQERTASVCMCCFYIRQKKKKFINVGLSNILDSELREVVGAAVVDSELFCEIFKLVSFYPAINTYCCFGYSIFFGIFNDCLTIQHGLCYLIHGE